MTDNEKQNNPEGSAPFNMAIDTLLSLGRIRDKITDTYSEPRLTSAQQQEIVIKLVKRFYITASPLLKAEVVKKYRPILDLRPLEQVERAKMGGVTGHTRLTFDHKLDVLLNRCLIELQQELQKEKFYMPPRNDPRFSWKQD